MLGAGHNTCLRASNYHSQSTLCRHRGGRHSRPQSYTVALPEQALISFPVGFCIWWLSRPTTPLPACLSVVTGFARFLWVPHFLLCTHFTPDTSFIRTIAINQAMTSCLPLPKLRQLRFYLARDAALSVTLARSDCQRHPRMIFLRCLASFARTMSPGARYAPAAPLKSCPSVDAVITNDTLLFPSSRTSFPGGCKLQEQAA